MPLPPGLSPEIVAKADRLRRLARGEIEYLISSMMVAHHLIMFARGASRGRQNASNYSMRLREASVPAE